MLISRSRGTCLITVIESRLCVRQAHFQYLGGFDTAKANNILLPKMWGFEGLFAACLLPHLPPPSHLSKTSFLLLSLSLFLRSLFCGLRIRPTATMQPAFGTVSWVNASYTFKTWMLPNKNQTYLYPERQNLFVNVLGPRINLWHCEYTAKDAGLAGQRGGGQQLSYLQNATNIYRWILQPQKG